MLNPCSLCKAECCKTYVITCTVSDVIRIRDATGRDPRGFCVLHEPRLLGFDPDMVIDTSDGYGRYLLGLVSHPCVFLDEHGRCTIHAHAPLSCRSYPFQIGGKMNARFCPFLSSMLFHLKGPDIHSKELASELGHHKSLVSLWNKRGGTRDEALSFFLDR